MKKSNNTRLVERYVPRLKAYAITDAVVERVWLASRKRSLFGGEILDMVYGKHGKRPVSRSAAHETISQINKRIEERYGESLMSTTAYRLENYPGEKAKRRGHTD